MEFKGKWVWITGASSGIGRETALQLARQGARLVLSSRRLDALEQVRQACVASDQHFCLPLDLEDSASLAGLAAQAWEQTGGIDILVNNGGMSQRSLALQTDLAVDHRIMAVDYFGTIALTKYIAPRMVERGSGHIVSISSIAGKMGAPHRSAYCGAKHALVGFMDCLRAEIANSGVTVHVVCPAFVNTDVAHNALTGDGTTYGQTDANIATGMPVDRFVEKMLAQLARNRSEITIAQGMPLLGYHIHRLWPNLYHRLLPRLAAT